MVLFEKFFGQLGFDFNDFSITQRRKILKFNEKTEETEMAIQLILNIEFLFQISDTLIDCAAVSLTPALGDNVHSFKFSL